ncbi:methyltransferase domain-containing protein [Pseudopelagicola sp. nBUS_20]|uniref:methyltransferase domain-containing protein n=1 Tax=Pseudopelagicola sp. nBUS_20 TaxID=3395317 RepID=UPI003EBF44CE
MQKPPKITDRKALLRNRERADLNSGMFLHHAAIEEITDRLKLINRNFSNPAIVTGFPEIWKTLLPNAQLIEDKEILALEEQSFDLVVHAMALHWANDPVGQLIQCKRALKPDGLFMAVGFGGSTLKELRSAITIAEAEVTGGLSPRIAPMAEVRDIGSLLQRAGFALPVADSVSLTATYETPWNLMRDLRNMGEANALEARLRKMTLRNVLIRSSELYVEQFMHLDRIPATFELIFLLGWAPHPEQPRPLRRGSANTRLADVLNNSKTGQQ